MTDGLDARLAGFTRARYGVFTRTVAHRIGFSEKQIRQRLAAGVWRAMSGEALMIAGCPLTFEARLLAATLTVPGAAGSHEAAGRVLRMAELDSDLLVVTVPRGSNHRITGARVHESSDLRARDVCRRWGIDVTSRERTLCDLGQVLSADDLRTVYNDQFHRGLVTLDGVYGVFYRYARRGRPGVAKVRDVLERYGPGFAVAESVLEQRTLELLRSAGLPLPGGQVQLEFWDRLIGRVDFAYVEDRIVIEVDGRLFHGPEVFESDRERDNAAGLAGWRVLRFTWKMVTERPDYVISTVTEALAQAHRRVA
jgi:hypothetical protein